MREINVLDLFADVMQHHAALERDRAQMRRQQRKVVRRQRGQEVVEASVLELPGKGGRAVWHRCRSLLQNGAPLADQVTRKCLLASNSLRAIGLRSKRFQSNTAADASISPVAQRNQIAGERRGGRFAMR